MPIEDKKKEEIERKRKEDEAKKREIKFEPVNTSDTYGQNLKNCKWD